jgi:hypothetical protein
MKAEPMTDRETAIRTVRFLIGASFVLIGFVVLAFPLILFVTSADMPYTLIMAFLGLGSGVWSISTGIECLQKLSVK